MSPPATTFAAEAVRFAPLHLKRSDRRRRRRRVAERPSKTAAAARRALITNQALIRRFSPFVAVPYRICYKEVAVMEFAHRNHPLLRVNDSCDEFISWRQELIACGVFLAY